MIDFHTHILPNIDDGSDNVGESIAMLKLLKAQGIQLVFATSHFYANHHTPQSFLKRRENAARKLREEVLRAGLEGTMPEIRLGAEVHYFSGISQCDAIRGLAIEGTNLLLLELPYGVWDESILEEIDAIERNLGMQVVLAHLDRYYVIGKNKLYIRRLLDMGILVQINIDAFLSFRSRRNVVKLMLEGRIYALGSDCHNLKERKPQWEALRNYIKKKNLIKLFDDIHENIHQNIEVQLKED